MGRLQHSGVQQEPRFCLSEKQSGLQKMDDQKFKLRVLEEGNRLDKWLAEQVEGLSRSAIQELIETGRVRVNGKTVKASYRVREGDWVVVELPPTPEIGLVPETISLPIVYEDRELLVVDKPAGMVVYPGPGHAGGTLVNALLALYPELTNGPDERPGIVHRLDRDTSGLMLIARNPTVRQALQRQFQARQVHKTYLALLEGELQPVWGRIEAPIGRDPRHRQRMTVMPEGREAVTEYHVQERFRYRIGSSTGRYTLVEAHPWTGRTHQIRVHFASIGYPVVGDRVYGRRRTRLPVSRQFLHAWRLEFEHPLSGERLRFEAPLPADLIRVLEELRAGSTRPGEAGQP